MWKPATPEGKKWIEEAAAQELARKAALQQKVDEAKVKMRSKNKKNKNPYKIKIV